MATRLIQVLTFTNVAGGATVPLAHSINVNGVPKIPDIVLQDNADFTVDSVSSTTATVTNTSGAPATLNLWLEYKHSMDRAFGDGSTQQLTPAPFVPATGGGGGGGGGAVTTDASLSGDGDVTPLSTNALGLDGAGTILSPLQIVGSVRPASQIVMFSDLYSANETDTYVVGAGFAAIGNDGALNDAFGAAVLNVTAVPDEAWLGLRVAPDTTPIDLGHYPYAVSEVRLRVDGGAAPTALLDYSLIAGLIINPTTGVGFGLGHSVYGNGNWWLSISGLGGASSVDTGVAVDGNWHRFMTVYDAAALEVRGYIDGELVATAALPNTNWSSTFQPTGASLASITTGATVRLDYVYFGVFGFDRS